MNHQHWAVILAGGDGLRLQPLTRLISGDERPKKICPIIGRSTLLGSDSRQDCTRRFTGTDSVCCRESP